MSCRSEYCHFKPKWAHIVLRFSFLQLCSEKYFSFITSTTFRHKCVMVYKSSRPHFIKLNIKYQCAIAFFLHFIVLDIPHMYFLFTVAKEAFCCLLFTTDSWPCATHPEEILTAGKVFNYILVSLRWCMGVWKQNRFGCKTHEKEFDNKCMFGPQEVVPHHLIFSFRLWLSSITLFWLYTIVVKHKCVQTPM